MITTTTPKSWLAKLRGQITPEWTAILPQRLIRVALWLVLASAGAALNYSVQVANSGFMPWGVTSAMYSPAGKVNLPYLGDWILISLGRNELMLSPGDIILFVAFLGIIATMITNRGQKNVPLKECEE